jgi:hypothetical protein
MIGLAPKGATNQAAIRPEGGWRGCLALGPSGLRSRAVVDVLPVCHDEHVDFLAAYAACKPLYEQAAEKLPPAAAIRVTSYAVTYRWMTDHLGREPLMREHAQALDVSRATYTRYRQDFRRAFGVSSPLDLPAQLVPSVPTLPLALNVS